jgi:hypothetical protein
MEVSLDCLLRFNILLNDVTFQYILQIWEYALICLTKKICVIKSVNANLADKRGDYGLAV